MIVPYKKNPFKKILLILIVCHLNFMISVICNPPQHAIIQELPLIIDHDGGVDDIIATSLHLLNNPEKIKAITIAPADCYDTPAVWVTTQLKKLFLPTHMHIPIGISTHEGLNPFPSIWREHAWNLTRIPLWKNEKNLNSFSLQDIPSALDVLTQALDQSPTQVVILETGPCSNIAQLLEKRPDLKDKINRIFIMGGAVYVKGNVEENGHDGSAEWNIYNNPQAFLDILRSKIPVTLVSLDATQYTPIRKEFIVYLQQHLTIKSFQMTYESLSTIQPLIDSGEYMFWDTLTSAVLINPNIIKTKKIKINVSLNQPSMGRTFEDAQGCEVDLAIWADQELFEKTVLDVLKKF